MMQSKKKKHWKKQFAQTTTKKIVCLRTSFIPPPQKKTIMVLIPYLRTTSIAFNFVFKKAKASNRLHAVLRVSSMKQTL